MQVAHSKFGYDKMYVHFAKRAMTKRWKNSLRNRKNTEWMTFWRKDRTLGYPASAVCKRLSCLRVLADEVVCVSTTVVDEGSWAGNNGATELGVVWVDDVDVVAGS